MSLPGSGGTATLLRLDTSNVVVEAIKPAEDGSGDVVVRLYEAKRTTCAAVLTTTLPVRSAVETDMLEREAKSSSARTAKFTSRFDLSRSRPCGSRSSLPRVHRSGDTWSAAC